MQHRNPGREAPRIGSRGLPAVGWLAAIGVALGALGDAKAQSDKDTLPPLARDIARILHLTERDEAALRAGEIVSTKLPEKDEKELHLGVAMLLPASAQHVFEQIRTGRILELDTTIRAMGEIPKPAAPLEALAGLELPPAEIVNLRQVEPGSIFNLASDEIAAVRKLADQDAADEALQNAFRKILAARLQAFAKSGLDGVAPYDRGRGKSADPARELRHAISQHRRLEQESPAFMGALGKAPGSSQELEEKLLWRIQDIQDRPTAILERRLSLDAFGQERGYGIAASQRFYVSQSFNSLLILAGVFRLGDQTLIFYSNQTFTDQVAGFGSSAAHAIGRKFMLAEIVKLFETVRASELARGS